MQIFAVEPLTGFGVCVVHRFLLILMPYGQFGQSILSNSDARRASIENHATTHTHNPVGGSTTKVLFAKTERN
jgi:hypothetical protein